MEEDKRRPMGAEWSDNEASVPTEGPGKPLSHGHGSEVVVNRLGPKLSANNCVVKEDRIKEPSKVLSDGPDSEVVINQPERMPSNIATTYKLPHNYDVIMKNADSSVDRTSMEKLYDHLYSGVFLNQRRKKYWVEKKSGNNCFMLLARDLSITWSDDNRYWHWPYFEESRDVYVNVAELLNVCWLEVHGTFDTSNLSPGIMYEVAFVVMLRDPAYGWEVPVNLRLVPQDGKSQEHKESLLSKLRGQWVELLVGEFHTSPGKVGDMQFSLFEYQGGQWKRGLVIKGVIIRPKN